MNNIDFIIENIDSVQTSDTVDIEPAEPVIEPTPQPLNNNNKSAVIIGESMGLPFGPVGNFGSMGLPFGPGPVGFQDPIRTMGVQGATRTMGAQGVTGSMGVQGVQGTIGSQGVTGTMGCTILASSFRPF
jgi:hypothetical protein